MTEASIKIRVDGSVIPNDANQDRMFVALQLHIDTINFRGMLISSIRINRGINRGINIGTDIKLDS